MVKAIRAVGRPLPGRPTARTFSAEWQPRQYRVCSAVPPVGAEVTSGSDGTTRASSRTDEVRKRRRLGTAFDSRLELT